MDFSVWGRQFTLWTFVSFQRSKASALLSLSYSLAQITPTSWRGKVHPRDRFCVVLLFWPWYEGIWLMLLIILQRFSPGEICYCHEVTRHNSLVWGYEKHRLEFQVWLDSAAHLMLSGLQLFPFFGCDFICVGLPLWSSFPTRLQEFLIPMSYMLSFYQL